MGYFIAMLSGPQISFKIRRGKRLAVEEALCFLAAFAEQELRLRLCLDAFGDDFQP